MTLASSADKPSKNFDELISTPIDFSAYIMNGLKITNLTQETLLGTSFKLLKGTRTNFAELEYDFEECYKALLEKLEWDNPEGGDYPFDLTKPLPLVMNGNRQMNRITNLSSNDVFDFAIALRMVTRSMVVQKRVKDLQLGVKSYQKKINVTKPETTRPDIRKRDPYTPYQDPQGFIYVDNQGRNKLMRSDELYKFNDGILTRLRTSLDDITKNIRMEYLPQKRWSSLKKKRAHIMIKAIDKQLKERRMMRSFEKFVGGRHYETDLWLLQ
ncbi:hypothetical protein Tco_0868345 [Tanacetum coccineum]